MTMNKKEYYHPPHDYGFYDQIIRFYPEEKRRIGTLTFQITEDCCLACTYCYQHNKSKNTMDFQIAKTLIDDILDNKYDLLNLEKNNGLIIEFIGGEPLLEIDNIQKIIDYYFEQAIIKNHEWLTKTRISICSNGILYFNSKVQEFLQKYNNFISFGISIDGNKELHDSCRIDINGNGSYDTAIKAVKHYRDNYENSIHTKMTLAPSNIQFLYPALLSLIENKYNIIHVNCIYEDGWGPDDPCILYEQLVQIGNYLLNNDLYDKINISLFDELIGEPMSEDDNKNWCGGCITEHSGFAIDYKGDIFPCIRYMQSSLGNKQPPLFIGNINHKLFFSQIEKENAVKLSNITRRSQSTDECFYCPVASGCSWCSAFNYEETGSPNKRVTYICNMHKARVLANIYFWNSLYQKLNINKYKKNNLSIKETIKIIGEKNYLQLLNKIDKGE